MKERNGIKGVVVALHVFFNGVVVAFLLPFLPSFSLGLSLQQIF